jgi:hypothetical protein
VVSNDRLEKRTIDILKLNERTLVFRGVEEGEILVTQPLVNVQEGTMVRTDMNMPATDRMAENKEGEEHDKEKSGGGGTTGVAVK